MAADPPKIGKQCSIALAPDVGATCLPLFAHDTDPWHGTYATFRPW